MFSDFDMITQLADAGAADLLGLHLNAYASRPSPPPLAGVDPYPADDPSGAALHFAGAADVLRALS